MTVLLDSTVLIDFLRGEPALERVLALEARGEVLGTTAVNVEEIFRGLREAEAEVAEQLFAGLEVAPISAADGRRAGEWRRQFATRGVTLSQSACLIAAAAHSAGAVLATASPEHFPMDGIEVEHWPAGR